MAKTKPSYAMSIRCYFPGVNNRRLADTYDSIAKYGY